MINTGEPAADSQKEYGPGRERYCSEDDVPQDRAASSSQRAGDQVDDGQRDPQSNGADKLEALFSQRYIHGNVHPNSLENRPDLPRISPEYSRESTAPSTVRSPSSKVSRSM